MLVRLCKSALENELDDCMAQLPAAVGENIRWGRDTEFPHIRICEVIGQLQRLGSDRTTLPGNFGSTLPLGDMLGEMPGTLMA